MSCLHYVLGNPRQSSKAFTRSRYHDRLRKIILWTKVATIIRFICPHAFSPTHDDFIFQSLRVILECNTTFSQLKLQNWLLIVGIYLQNTRHASQKGCRGECASSEKSHEVS